MAGASSVSLFPAREQFQTVRTMAKRVPKVWGTGVMCLYAALAGALPAACQQEVLAVRTAYIYNLTKYISWPAEKHQITVCHLGDRSAGLSVAGVLNEKDSDNRTIRVVLYTGNSDPGDCDVLYVSGASHDIRATLSRVHGRKVLTIGDTDDFVTQGGMIGLVRTGDRIQLDINLEAARAAGFQISSRVLALAFIVHSGRDLR